MISSHVRRTCYFQERKDHHWLLNKCVAVWSNIIGSSLEIFGYLRKSSVIFRHNFRKIFENVCLAFGYLRKGFGNLRKIVKKVVLSMFIYKQNNTWVLVNVKFLLSCLSFKSSWTLEEKFYVYVRSCIILYTSTKYNTSGVSYELINFPSYFARCLRVFPPKMTFSFQSLCAYFSSSSFTHGDE